MAFRVFSFAAAIILFAVLALVLLVGKQGLIDWITSVIGEYGPAFASREQHFNFGLLVIYLSAFSAALFVLGIYHARARLYLRDIFRLFWSLADSVYGSFSAMKYKEKAGFLALMSLVVLHASYRACSFPVHIDEIASFLFFVERGPAVTVAYYPSPNNHVFFNVLCWPVSLVTNNVLPVMRIVPVLCFTGISAAIFLFVRSKYSAVLAFAVVITFSFHTHLMYYATHGRGYLPSLAFLIVVWWSWVYRGPTRGTTMLGAIMGALAIYTVPSAIVGIVGLLMARTILYPTKQGMLQVMSGASVTFILCGILFGPILVFNGFHSVFAHNWHQEAAQFFAQQDLWSYAGELSDYLWGLGNGGLWFGLLFLALGALYLVVLDNDADLQKLVLTWLSMLFSVIAFVLIAGVMPPVRVWLFIVPFGLVGIWAVVFDFAKQYLEEGAAKKWILVPTLLYLLFGSLRIERSLAEEKQIYTPYLHAAEAVAGLNLPFIFISDPDYYTYLKWYLTKVKGSGTIVQPYCMGNWPFLQMKSVQKEVSGEVLFETESFRIVGGDR